MEGFNSDVTSILLLLMLLVYLKATEHVIGNVRCAPGCFSLFRASAINENKSTDKDVPSVIDMYSTVTKR